eukprot:scaffold28624_cov62-Phaeocystis_antarctica.AAC.8
MPSHAIDDPYAILRLYPSTYHPHVSKCSGSAGTSLHVDQQKGVLTGCSCSPPPFTLAPYCRLCAAHLLIGPGQLCRYTRLSFDVNYHHARVLPELRARRPTSSEERTAMQPWGGWTLTWGQCPDALPLPRPAEVVVERAAEVQPCLVGPRCQERAPNALAGLPAAKARRTKMSAFGGACVRSGLGVRAAWARTRRAPLHCRGQ